VRRDVGRHAHGDAGCAVDQQVGHARRQDDRLFQRAVEVLDKVDGVLVDVGQHVLAHRRHARFGVAHGGGAVPVDAAEVALAVDQGVAHGEVLGHAHHRLVDSHISMRVVLAQHLADDARALLVGAVRPEAHIVHRVQDATVDGLEAVAGIRQRPGDDHAHGVVEVGFAHFLVDFDRSNNTDIHAGIPSWPHSGLAADYDMKWPTICQMRKTNVLMGCQKGGVRRLPPAPRLTAAGSTAR